MNYNGVAPPPYLRVCKKLNKKNEIKSEIENWSYIGQLQVTPSHTPLIWIFMILGIFLACQYFLDAAT